MFGLRLRMRRCFRHSRSRRYGWRRRRWVWRGSGWGGCVSCFFSEWVGFRLGTFFCCMNRNLLCLDLIHWKGRLKSVFRRPLFYISLSVAEMADACYHHRNTVFVRCIKDFLVAHGACWMDDGFDTLLGNDIYAVAEWEEGIGSGTCAV